MNFILTKQLIFVRVNTMKSGFFAPEFNIGILFDKNFDCFF